MKKIFTLAAALMASFSLWAQDPTLPADATPSEALSAKTLDENVRCITNAVHNNKQYFVYSLDTARTEMKAGNIKWVASPKTDGGNSATIKFASEDAEVNYGFTEAGTRAWGLNKNRYAGIRVINCSEFAALTRSNSTKDGKTLYMQVFKKNAEAWDFVESLGEDIYDNSKYYVLSASLDPAEEYVILLTSGNTSNCLTAQIRLASGALCTDPEFTVSPTEGTGFVGDPIEIAVTSKNQSKPINPAVTVDGVAAVYGTDYTFSASTGLVQATPLKAGTFEITFSQASDGTYCDAEESVTFVITEKTPVTFFEVEGPSEARLGDEVTLTATNFNAAPTRVWWLDASTGEEIHEGATYTFTASNYGTFEYLVLARNDFNDPDEESYDYAFGMFGSVNVTVGTDATLSDLKVNGATIDDFAADKYEYNVELGVYEALNVEATAADAPYASAVVVDDGESKVTITVTAQNKSTKEYVINYIRAKASELASISNDAIWDFTKTGATTIQLTNESLPKKSEEFVFADLLTNPDASFNAAALAGIQEYVVRDGKFCQGSQLRFVTTVPGTLEVVYSNTGNRTKEEERRFLVVNGVKIGEGSMKSGETVTESNIDIAAGEVVLTGILADESAQFLRFYKISFVKSPQSAIENADAAVKAVKVVRDGQMFILKNGVLYNMQGAVVK